MNPEMATPISDLAGLAIIAYVVMASALAAASPRVRAWVAKRAGRNR
jgi:hypothetical protein